MCVFFECRAISVDMNTLVCCTTMLLTHDVLGVSRTFSRCVYARTHPPYARTHPPYHTSYILSTALAGTHAPNCPRINTPTHKTYSLSLPLPPSLSPSRFLSLSHTHSLAYTYTNRC